MSIYQVYPITDNIVNSFRPTRLAIKELAGKFYFCKTTLEDFDTYTGSGVAWQKRIMKYGKENIKTLWVSDWYYDPYEIQKVALDFSRENQIVESKKWANLKPENGLDGGGCLSDDSKDLVRQYQNSKVSDGTHHLLSGEIQGKASRERVKNGTHNLLGSEPNQKRIDDGTHNFLGKNGENHYRYDSTLYTFINKSSGETVTLTKRKFIAEKLNDDLSNTSNLVAMTNGKRKTIKGWSLVK